jgi:hypothetical protein
MHGQPNIKNNNNSTIKFKFHLQKSTEQYRSSFLQRDHCTYNNILTIEPKPNC